MAESKHFPPVLALALILAGGVPAPQALAEVDVEQLLRRLDELESRVRYLESLGLERDERAIIERRVMPDAVATEAADGEVMGDAVPGVERTALVAEQAAGPDIHVGGALRFNLVHRDFVDASDTKRGESGLDVFRLNVDGSIANVLLSAEYRFYSYMNTIHHGWIGYQFGEHSQVQLGIHQVPFGLLPYAAHNAWFGVPYYVGLADDYDMGAKYQYQQGPWTAHLAFYKNEELNDPTDVDRYGFDLVRVGEQQNEEINQFHGRLAYTFGHGGHCENELGLSARRGEIYNALTDRRGDNWAAAVHVDSRCGRWNLQLQGARYAFNPANPASVSRDSVRVGAFGGSYDIASRGDILVANLAYNFPSRWTFIDQVTCYNNYSRLFKDGADSIDSQINTIGCAIGSGPLFTYVDYILANNMAFFGDGSMAVGGRDEWRRRFNVNIGYYW